MGRSVDGPKPNFEREFIPEAFENREDPDPYKIWIRDPTEADKRQLVALQTGINVGAPGESIDLASMIRWQQEAIRIHVLKVTGYSVREIEIVDGETLAEHGESEIVAEVALEIFAAASLSETEKKHSKKRSGSKSRKIDRSNGTAASASKPANTSIEIAAAQAVTASGT